MNESLCFQNLKIVATSMDFALVTKCLLDLRARLFVIIFLNDFFPQANF